MLSPLGSVVNGAHAWINLPGGFQVEPSEFAKLAEVLICALVLSRLDDAREAAAAAGDRAGRRVLPRR